MNRTVLSVLLGAVVLFAVAALLTGDADWVVPVLVLLVVVALGTAAVFALRARVERGADAIPAAQHESRGERPLGDTADAHDDLSPHDLPKEHPGREEAERLSRFDREGTTTGNVDR
jgi:hypothetical protein